jgi:hypothetical protein
VLFPPDKLMEIEYAALLHDVGKIGVREHVLVKAKKLYEWQLEAMRSRFLAARCRVGQCYAELRLAALRTLGPEKARALDDALEEACRQQLDALDKLLRAIETANEPGAPDGMSPLVSDAEQQVIRLPTGETLRLLDDAEREALTLTRGTLTTAEVREMQEHVRHSYEFLRRIPWTQDLQEIPTIAQAHHEKLNGSGYPRGLRAEGIPLQAKMMTIVDTLDAMAAQDRPYKGPMPIPEALAALEEMARRGTIDADLLRLVIEHKIYDVVEHNRTGARETPAAPGVV